MRQVMLTTFDNPFDPFDKFDEWRVYDELLGYHTPSLLARHAIVSYDLSEEEYHRSIELAMDEIIKINASGMHRKLVRITEE